MLLKIGRQPDHTFAEPLGLLSDCHRRIEHFLSVLIAITEVRHGGTLNPSERAQLEAALGYFATAAPRHTADEEESLFPRLRASRDPAALAALALVERLEDDHAAANAYHDAVDGLVRKWIAADALPPADVRLLEERLKILATMYQAHIRLEDRELFPTAARILTAREIEEIGVEMSERRSIAAR
jgi:hemerythrin-like domain-containing protein